MVRPPDGLLRLPNRLRRGPRFEVCLGPQEWKVKCGYIDPFACVAGLFRALRVSIRQGMPEMVRVRVWMTLNDGDASGHRDPRQKQAVELRGQLD